MPTPPSESKAADNTSLESTKGPYKRKQFTVDFSVTLEPAEAKPISYWKWFFGFGFALELVAVFATLRKMQPDAFVDFMKPSGDLADLIHGRGDPSFGDIFSNNLTTGTGIFATVLVGIVLLTWAAQRYAANRDPDNSVCDNVRNFFVGPSTS